MPPRKRAVKAVARPLPQSAVEVDEIVTRIGELQRDLSIIDLAADEETAAIATMAAAEKQPLLDELVIAIADVSAYAEVHRDALTDNGKTKTFKLPSGSELRWRFTPPAVTLKGVEAIKERLKSLELDRFIRTKEEIDKEAMLKEPSVASAVEGVTIGRVEEFVIVPTSTNAEISQKLKKKTAGTPKDS